MPHRKRHLAPLLALPILLTLLATPAGALPLERALPDLLSRGWSFLSSLWAEVGCSVDPFGHCGESSAPAPILSEGGCSIDPHGLCGAVSAPAPILSEEGCSIDPHGRRGQ
jgi:hypothetical protein